LRGISSRAMAYTEEDHMYQAGDTTYQYDVDGFLMSKTKGGTEKTEYAYSSKGELLQVKLPDGRIIEYVYDPFGRRIAKMVNGTVTEKYLWQGTTTLLAVYDGSNNLLMRFEYADIWAPLSMSKNGITYYLTYDQAGSLRVVTDASGNVVKRIDYDSFGNIINDTNPSFDIPLGFAVGLFDRDTGLVKFGFRDYDPDIGRWTAKDPIGFWGGDTDLYGYCLNNPINLVDPWGLIWVTVGYDYHIKRSALRLYLNRWTEQIGKGMKPTMPGASEKEWVGLKRDIIQEWQSDPDNPCRDKEYPLGARRRILQTWTVFMYNWDVPILLNKPLEDGFWYYTWDPLVPNYTYKEFPNTTYENIFYWRQGP